MNVDLSRLAERLAAAAERTRDYRVTCTATDLILSKDGYGTGKSESVPYPSLFLREDDALGAAIDRLERGFPQAA